MRITSPLLVAATLWFAAFSASAAPDAPPSAHGETLKKIHPSLLEPGTRATVVVRFTRPPLLATLGKNAKTEGIKLTRQQQVDYVNQLRRSQDVVTQLAAAKGGNVVGHLTKTLNAVLVTIDTAQLPAIAELASVASIRPVANYEQDLSETVPYIGAATVQQNGITGAGVRIAVIDSGIDYTHRNLGGAGTLAAYEAAYGADTSDPKNTTRDGLFPTAKVVGGWDFLGENWPNVADIEPDEDPIDYGGHGTHVADIIAGASADGLHKGVAPGASLYAFKVCSSVATACNGISILLALEACLSPDHPVDYPYIEDPVDVINLSLGSSYGQFQDDSSYAVEILSSFGIAVVVSAGNSGDLPYVVGSPSIAPSALSVAQTQVPSAKAFAIRIFKNGNRVTSSIINTADLDWAPLNKTVSGPLVYVGRGCVGDQYLVAEKNVKNAIVIVDRGTCAVSEKIDRAARLGAKGVIIVNNVAGDPPSFSQGGGSKFVPTLVVSRDDGNALKASLVGNKVRATFGPGQFTSLTGSMASTSSRGPSYSFQTIKPEIGAPGASVSAEVGTGNGETAFGGTSGAAPMVSGSAALVQNYLVESLGSKAPGWVVKALLMNNAEPEILINPVSLPGILAPITRIGAGEVRVDRAIAAQALAVAGDYQPALSFGYQAAINPGPITLTQELAVYDISGTDRTFELANAFRYADDEATGAVAISFSTPTLEVPAFDVGTVVVTLTIDPTKLPVWALNGGTQGGNGNRLRIQEFDGYVTIKDEVDSLRLPWQVLPRKAADLELTETEIALADGSGATDLLNPHGAVAGTSEIFLLGGTSPEDYPKPDAFGANQALPDLKAAGIRAKNGVLEVGIATYEERSHSSYPAGFEVDLDTDGDGNVDYALYNTDSNGNTIVNVYSVADGVVLGTVAADVDLDSATITFRVPLNALGLTDASTVLWYLLAYDNYFTGAITDAIYDPDFLFLAHTLDKPRYSIAGLQTRTVAGGATDSLAITETPENAGWSPSQQGFLLLHRNAQPGHWSEVISVTSEPPLP